MADPLFEHLLVPTDGSESSVQAGRLAFRIAKAHDARVTLLHVVDTEVMEELARFSEKQKAEVRAELQKTGQSYLDHLDNLAQQLDLAVGKEMHEGEPHKAIVAAADEIGADLIVMGHVGRRGPRRILVGSVTERVIRFAHCPVLVVKEAASAGPGANAG